MQVICSNCIHKEYVPPSINRPCAYFCNHPKSISVNIVTGAEHRKSCAEQRSDPKACSISGRWYVEKSEEQIREEVRKQTKTNRIVAVIVVCALVFINYLIFF